MEKKKFTSWGISFASLALVAGAMAYFGITDQTTNQSGTQAVQSQASSDQQSDQASDTSTVQQTATQSSSGLQQHGFHTTTGGS
ncbi:hypothetical protein [Ectobacillus ponti]|uniref:Uncharacterized protein n=1 Tax=Ectobacillus ponti TaxID=2961894 RepID=A0AA41XC09_9BACI|nr:hypothetical protein [Ectobacillus ponti]MCP8970670.1 hypothetical protein [Ectobacillus ponti]